MVAYSRPFRDLPTIDRNTLIGKIYEIIIYRALLANKVPEEVIWPNEKLPTEWYLRTPTILFFRPDFVILDRKKSQPEVFILATHCNTTRESHNKFWRSVEELFECKVMMQAETGKNIIGVLSIHGDEGKEGEVGGFRLHHKKAFQVLFDYVSECFDDEDLRNKIGNMAISVANAAGKKFSEATGISDELSQEFIRHFERSLKNDRQILEYFQKIKTQYERISEHILQDRKIIPKYETVWNEEKNRQLHSTRYSESESQLSPMKYYLDMMDLTCCLNNDEVDVFKTMVLNKLSRLDAIKSCLSQTFEEDTVMKILYNLERIGYSTFLETLTGTCVVLTEKGEELEKLILKDPESFDFVYSHVGEACNENPTFRRCKIDTRYDDVFILKVRRMILLLYQNEFLGTLDLTNALRNSTQRLIEGMIREIRRNPSFTNMEQLRGYLNENPGSTLNDLVNECSGIESTVQELDITAGANWYEDIISAGIGLSAESLRVSPRIAAANIKNHVNEVERTFDINAMINEIRERSIIRRLRGTLKKPENDPRIRMVDFELKKIKDDFGQSIRISLVDYPTLLDDVKEIHGLEMPMKIAGKVRFYNIQIMKNHKKIYEMLLRVKSWLDHLPEYFSGQVRGVRYRYKNGNLHRNEAILDVILLTEGPEWNLNYVNRVESAGAKLFFIDSPEVFKYINQKITNVLNPLGEHHVKTTKQKA